MNRRRFLGYFFQFVLYNAIFLGLQFFFIWAKSRGFMHIIPLPRRINAELFYALLVHVGEYLILSLMQTILLWGLMPYRLQSKNIEHCHAAIFGLSVCAVLSLNSYFFPLSHFNQSSFMPFSPGFCVIGMFISLMILGALFLNVLFMALLELLGAYVPRLVRGIQESGKISGFRGQAAERRQFFIRTNPDNSGRALFITAKKAALPVGVVLVAVMIGFWHRSDLFTPTSRHAQKDLSNVVVIGIDSLAPHYIHAEQTPTLAHFMEHAIWFQETISPLARTYPAWVTILTGLYPHHHHARYNLMPPMRVASDHSIAWRLQEAGYQTLFATDERRFNNMDKEFGFQTVIGPRMGANDMFLGTFNDLPLNNFLVNLPIAQKLLPYNHMNRASYVTYYPKTFDRAVHQALIHANKTTPFFIAVHFTLPHWPYAWAESPPSLVKDVYDVEDRYQLYLNAITRVDEQVNDLLTALKQQGYLKNSLVILLSDHGEALYRSGSRQTSRANYQGIGLSQFEDYLNRKTSTSLDMSVGHGSDLLSRDQFHCVLAFQVYQKNHVITKKHWIKTRVALLDIVPTVYDFLNIPLSYPVDGISLWPAIQNKQDHVPKRTFVMESGMLPNQIFKQEEVQKIGANIFLIDPRSGHVVLREDHLAMLDSLKLYAVIKGNWLMALYPDDEGYIPVTLHLRNQKWTDELHSHFAHQSPAQSMLRTLRQFYEKDWPLANT